MTDSWYFARGKQKYGPYSLAQMRQFVQSGQLHPGDMVHREGMGRWLPAAEVGELAATTSRMSSVPVPPATGINAPRLGTGSRFNVKTVAIIAGGSMMSMCLFCCCGSMFMGVQSEKATRENLAEADRLWTAGHTAEAIGKYKAVIDGSLSIVDADRRGLLLQRVIDYEAEAGNHHSAKRFIEKAVDRNITLNLNNQDARRLLAEVQAAAETKKLAAALRKETEKEKAESQGAGGPRTFTVSKGGIFGGNILVQVDASIAEEITLSDLRYDKAMQQINLKMKYHRGSGWRYTLYDKDNVKLETLPLSYPDLRTGDTAATVLHVGPHFIAKVTRIVIHD